MLTSLFGLSVGSALGYLEAHKRRAAMATIEAHKRRIPKLRIKGANTEQALIYLESSVRMTLNQLRATEDYIEELRTQAKWDAE